MADFFTPNWPVPANVKAIVSTRQGGVSAAPYDSCNLALHVGDEAAAVLSNRRELAFALACLPEPHRHTQLQWQWLDQVHSSQVVRISSAQEKLVADGLITSTPGIACCVLTADCLPIFVAANDGSEVAIVHAGWRGMAAGIIANTINQMSSPPAQLLVWLGPAIGPCHFEVGAQVRDAFMATMANAESCFEHRGGGEKYMADLPQLARLQLTRLGVNQISGGQECTYCLPEKYYSFRRSNSTGRQLGMIYLG